MTGVVEISDAGSQQVQIQGAVDLAKLASSLRSTLAIHDDVVIQQGRMTFGLRASAGSGKDIAFLTSPLSDLVAVCSGAASSPSQIVSAIGQKLTPVQPVSMTSREITDGRSRLLHQDRRPCRCSRGSR